MANYNFRQPKGQGVKILKFALLRLVCTPRADGASVLLHEVVFEKRAFKLDF